MFGLTLEKLFLVALVAGLVIGPSRLPGYAAKFGEYVRAARRTLETARQQAHVDLGVSREEWESWDVRRYDPRRIVREAWDESAAVRQRAARGERERSEANQPDQSAESDFSDEVYEQAARVRPGQKYLVAGSAAHPERVRLTSLADNDPRRLAAEPVQMGHVGVES